jgi:hypothetical protein
MCFPKFEVAPHHKLVFEKLQALEKGEIDRLIISMPPRHSKSLIVSELFPAWFLGRNPDRQVILSAYGSSLAQRFGGRVRNTLKTDLYKTIFGNILSDDSQSKTEFETKSGGSLSAVGVGGAITGKGADLLLIDDPVKSRAEAESHLYRENTKDWYNADAYTRLMPNGRILLIGTRWHEDDLIGYLLREKQHENWEVVNLPAIAEFTDELGRKAGEALWTERYPLSKLQDIRRSLPSRDWESLYQQKPLSAVGGAYLHGIWKPEVHLLKAFPIPTGWKHWRGLDWGFDKPYSVGWYAQDFDGNIYRYRELYGWGGEPNVGTHETAQQVAEQMLKLDEAERTRGVEFKNNIGDLPSSNGATIGVSEHFIRAGIYFNKPAKKGNSGHGYRVDKAHEIVVRLNNSKIDEQGKVIGGDGFFAFDTCKHFVRTVPVMMRDPKNGEDIDTTQEDHTWDEVTDSLVSRRTKPRKQEEGNMVVEGSFKHLYG